MADLLGMNLSPPPGVFLPGVPWPSLEGVPDLEGDLFGALEGVFLVRDSLSLFMPLLPLPNVSPALAFRLELELSRAFLCLGQGALFSDESILVVDLISFSREKRLIDENKSYFVEDL